MRIDLVQKQDLQRADVGVHRDMIARQIQDALVQCARFDHYTEPVCGAARMLYAAPNRLTRHRLAKLDLPRSDSMRAPGDAIGLLALECAMDELAETLGLDPVELRLRNDTQIDPERDRPFASRHLAEWKHPLQRQHLRLRPGSWLQEDVVHMPARDLYAIAAV